MSSPRSNNHNNRESNDNYDNYDRTCNDDNNYGSHDNYVYHDYAVLKTIISFSLFESDLILYSDGSV